MSESPVRMVGMKRTKYQKRMRGSVHAAPNSNSRFGLSIFSWIFEYQDGLFIVC